MEIIPCLIFGASAVLFYKAMTLAISVPMEVDPTQSTPKISLRKSAASEIINLDPRVALTVSHAGNLFYNVHWKGELVRVAASKIQDRTLVFAPI